MSITYTLIVLFIFGLAIVVFAIAGVYLAYRGFRDRSQGAVAQEWPFTSGVIEESTVRSITTTSPEGETQTEWIPYVRYSYKVNNNAYTASHLSPGLINTGAGEEQARTLAARYPVGSSVTVWYNPKAPTEAVLEKRAGSSGASLILGLVLIGISLGMICLFVSLAIFGFIAVAIR